MSDKIIEAPKESWTSGVILEVYEGGLSWPNVRTKSKELIIDDNGFVDDWVLANAYAKELVNRWNQHDILTSRVKVLEEALNIARCDIKMLSSLEALQKGNPVEYIDKALEADNG